MRISVVWNGTGLQPWLPPSGLSISPQYASRHTIRHMEVTFTRTGERRYRVIVEREKASDLIMDPAPGYDPFLPHDLVHLLVECEWGIRTGIFGQLAAGGDAGTFRPLRMADLRKQRAIGQRLRSAGRHDTGKSERLAHLAHVAWQIRQGHKVAPWDFEAHRQAPEVDTAILDRTLARLDQLAERWHALGVGGSITLSWPWPEARPAPRARAKREHTGAVRRR